jgi:hypothetical protein
LAARPRIANFVIPPIGGPRVKPPFSLFLALRYLKPKRTFVSTITLVSVLGVTLGITVLIVVISVMTGFDQELRRKVLGFDAHLLLHSDTFLDPWRPLQDQVDKTPGVVASAPFVQGPVIVEFNHHRLTPKIRGIDPERESKITNISNTIQSGAYDLDGDKAVIGRVLSESLGKAEKGATPLTTVTTRDLHSRGQQHQDGRRDIKAAPTDYAHNCPWNDWTTPSESARLFHAATTTPHVDKVSRRIRVHVITSPDITAHAMIAFSTVEMNVEGKEALVVRRGAETLASLVLSRIHLTSDKMLIKLTVATRRQGVPSIYLLFEDVKRLNAFIIMLSNASIERASQ